MGRVGEIWPAVHCESIVSRVVELYGLEMSRCKRLSPEVIGDRLQMIGGEGKTKAGRRNEYVP